MMSFRPLMLLCVAAPIGCGGADQVRTHSHPKPAAATPVAVEPAGGESRVLGAMLPADKPEWFFKMTAAPARIDAVVADFETLVKSVKLVPGAEPTYTLPAGWTAGPVKTGTVRQMTIVVPGGLEMTVTQASGDPVGNVTRWAGQVGMTLAAADVGKYTRTVDTAGGTKALIADVKGTAAGGRGPFMGMGGPPTAPPAAGPAAAAGTEYRILAAMLPADKPEWFFKLTGSAAVLEPVAADFDKFIASVKTSPNGPPTFDLPAGWSNGPPKNDGITAGTVRVPGELLLTVTRAGGDPAGNIARWAGQVGAKDAGKTTRTLDTAGGAKALVADVRGPNNPTGRGPMTGGR